MEDGHASGGATSRQRLPWFRCPSQLLMFERASNVRTANLSAQLTVPSRPWRMTRIQIRISQLYPTASIHQRGTLLRLCYCGVLRAGAPPAMLWRIRVPVTQSQATVQRWMGAARTTRGSRRSGPAEDRARTGGGPEQEDRGRIRADDVYPECWRSIH
jgi:hypothetical protein